MDIEKHKIPSPYRAPDGYFDNFESRLLQKISHKPEKHLKVSRGGLAPMEYAAIAATLAAIMVTAWFVLMKPTAQEQPSVVSAPQPAAVRDTLTLTPAIPDAAEVETALIQDILEEPVQENPVAVSTETVSYSTTDLAIAMQLEEAGLIVLDADDGLFEPFEL